MAAVAAPEMEDLRAPQMMCFQCEQTNAGKGCTTTGVCKKSPQTSGLQDLTILHALRLCQLAHVEGGAEAAVRDLVLEPLFATLTNVNFDDARFEQYLKDLAAHIAQLEARLKAGGQAVPAAPKALPAKLPETKQELLAAAEPAGLLARSAEVANEDLFGVIEMCAYGLKGTCAYFYHAEHLLAGDAAYSEAERTEVYKEIFRLGNYLAEVNSTTAKENALGVALGECLAVGALNLKVMKMLDSAHTTLLGTPTPVEVTQEQPESPAILVSGHDLAVLHRLLPQADKRKVNVYTHGEMLPAHSYPKLRKFENLKGHFGTHWGNQQKEFRHFPGVILMTSNCMMPPVGKYRDRIWTCGPVGFDKIPQVEDDFSALIQQALEFKDSVPVPRSGVIPHRKLQVLGVADKVVEAIQSGALKHVFVIGGCDGTENSRSYFTDLAADTPQDSIILTLGCGKFRLNGHDHGTLAGLPRLLDVGQCNDAYGAVVIATKLAEALKCTVHDLPLHFAVSWFEQKAVAVLLTLLHLNLKNIRLGPALPGFITPNVLKVLNEKFGLKPARLHEEDVDLAEMLKGE